MKATVKFKTKYMKNLLISWAILLISFFDIQAQKTEYKVLTSVESIIPAGLGRSRLLESKSEVNPDDFTTERTEGNKSVQGSVKRKDLKIDELNETKLLNFFSPIGINFQNIASNDAIIGAKLTEMASLGWELAFVVSGVESDGGKDDGQGIYVTRYIFKRTQ